MSYVLVQVPDWIPEQDREWISEMTERMVEAMILHHDRVDPAQD